MALFTIIGDSNVRRNMTSLNVASRTSMKTAQVLDCANLASLDSCFQEVKAETEVLIVAAVTEFLLSGGNCGTILSTIDPVLATFASKIINFCAFRPHLKVEVLFGTYRGLCLPIVIDLLH